MPRSMSGTTMLGERIRDVLPRGLIAKYARSSLDVKPSASTTVTTARTHTRYLITRRGQREEGHGTVYFAYDTRTSRPVVLKRLPRTKAAMDEASAYATVDKLNHPHIAKFIETFDDGESITVITECCEGGDLLDRVPVGEGISIEAALRYAAQLTDALAHMHAAGYAHGDIKIDNCCISRDGKLQLVDFGCSVDVAELGDAVFVPGSSTKAYTAPEVFSRRCDDPCAADVWAAGIALVVLATGWLPWETATSHSHSWLRHWRGEDIFKQLPDDLHKIVHAMLKVSPRERATAAEAHGMLAEALAARTTASVAA